jgi:ABC-type nitrate/sulfonate/bicarbonate transport system substrate-binding protein
MRKTLLIMVLFSIFLFAQDAKKVTLQLNWLNQFQFAGYYIAKEKGFYSDVNLDVHIKEFNFDINVIEEIKTKRADFSIGRSSLLIDKINAEDVVALGAIFQESPLMLLVKKDSNINEVKDLKNKKIMFTKDTSYSASILAMLSASKLKTGDYEIQEHSFNINDLISGKTDAMASYLSNEPILLKEKGIEYKIFHPKDYGFNFYSDILFSSSKFIKDNPKLTKDFYNASIKGWEYAFDNLAETAEIIYSKYNTQNKTLIQLIKEGEILKKLAYSNNEGLGYLNESKLNDIINIFRIFGLGNINMDIDDFIYDGNPHKITNIKISKQDKKYIIFTLIILFIILCFAIYFFSKNRQIKKTFTNSNKFNR